jgi:hypothetical protein
MGNVIAYLTKNLAILIGIAEALLKAFAGIVSLTPTKADDKVYGAVDKIFSKIKGVLYTFGDNIAS